MSADELARFNMLPAPAARAELLACCNSPAWAERMASGRPYSSARDAVRQSSAIVTMLTVPDLEQALAGHARIVAAPAEDDRDSEPSAFWPGQGQAGGSAPDPETCRELAESSLEYERRFGHAYLVCAPGRTGTQLLALIQTRLRNSPAAEWQVVRTELQKINAIRLIKLLAGTR